MTKSDNLRAAYRAACDVADEIPGVRMVVNTAAERARNGEKIATVEALTACRLALRALQWDAVEAAELLERMYASEAEEDDGTE